MSRQIVGLGGALALLWLLALVLAGCSQSAAQAQQLRVGGGLDVAPLWQEAAAPFQASTGISLTIRPPRAPIQELKSGKLDAVLLGRTPTAEEMEGLMDRVVAHDALFVVVDTRSYLGGLQADLTFHPAVYKAKTSGLRELSMDQLRALYTNRIRADGPIWEWEGHSYTFRLTGKGPDKISEDPDNPGYAMGRWRYARIYLIPDLWRPDTVDTQGALFAALGLPEADIVTSGINQFLPKFLESEEELVSYRYAKGPEPASVSNDQFTYRLAVLSRRVAQKALDHGFRLRPLAIDGVDPLSDLGAVISGSYPLARQIHLLTRAGAAPDADALGAFLLSSEGQQLVAASGFLPLNPSK
jgi:ABC-type phosphate transport system substrate-binding protein